MNDNIIPEHDLNLVRFGVTDPTRVWRELFEDLVRKIAER